MQSIVELYRIDLKNSHDIAATLVSEYGDNLYTFYFDNANSRSVSEDQSDP